MPRRSYKNHVIEYHLDMRDDGKTFDLWFTLYRPDGTYKHYNVNHPPGFPSEYQAMKFGRRWGFALIAGESVDERVEPMD